MPARLLYRDAQGHDAFVDILESTPAFLGRGTDCAVRTEDALVSRKNCKVSFAGGRYVVEDLGSANGTYVNEQRIQKQVLNHADIIRCGSLQVRYVEVAAQPAAAAKPGRSGTAEMNAQPEPQVQEPAVQVAADAANDQAVAAITEERNALKKQLDDAKAELEPLRGKMESADLELKRLRSDAISSRDELAKTKRDAAQDKDELHAVTRVAEELKKSLNAARDENVALKSKVEELTEDLATRDRQLERAQDDVKDTKKTTEELRNKLGELQKTKDEGWRELNSQLAQVEHLREVISEQERILEERRVGLISLESAAKDLRAEKERTLRELVDTKNARDELKDKLNRAESRVEGLEEEHRRLARAMNEGGSQNGDEIARVSEELRNLKVDYKKLQTDLQRSQESFERAEADRRTVSDEKAKIDVERAQLVEEKKTAEAARARAEEARAKAEGLRQRAEEEKQAGSAARDTALQAADDLRRNVERAEKKVAELTKAAGDAVELERSLDKAQRRVDELEEALGAAKAAAAEAIAAAAAPAKDAFHGDVTPMVVPDDGARARAIQAEAERDEALKAKAAALESVQRQTADLQRLGGELKKAQDEIAKLQADLSSNAGRAQSAEEATGKMAAVAPAGGGDAAMSELRNRAQDVYDGINSALSELRTTIITAKGLYGEVGPKIADEDARKALGDALADSMERTEDAKGLLRTLKELAQG